MDPNLYACGSCSATCSSSIRQLERQQLADLLKYMLIVISTVPVMRVYPFVARFFNKGILAGAVKG